MKHEVQRDSDKYQLARMCFTLYICCMSHSLIIKNWKPILFLAQPLLLNPEWLLNSNCLIFTKIGKILIQINPPVIKDNEKVANLFLSERFYPKTDHIDYLL